MKKYIKKISIVLFVLAFLFSWNGAFASVSWNGDANDCPDINIATTGNGYGNPCWTGTNITANPGSFVDVKIYYHNTGNSTASNTHIKINAPSGSATYQSFSGAITSSGGNNLYTSQVSVTIPSAQTLTLSSTWWYTKDSNGTLHQTAFLNGQSGSEVISSSGLYIGDIAPGWQTQGAVVARFQISNNSAPSNCEINYFNANPNSIQSGDSSTLSWDTDGCTSVYISNGIGSVNTSGSHSTGPLYNTKTYTLTASGNGSSDSDTVTVNVSESENCEINYFNANPSSVESGDSSTLSWSTTGDCTSANISGGIGSVNTSGSHSTGALYSDKTFTLNVYGNNSSDSEQVTVHVDEQQESCRIDRFDVSPTSIDEGDSVNVEWDTTGCDSVSVYGSNFSDSSLDGDETAYPEDSGYFTITAYASGSYVSPQKIYVEVDEDNNDDCEIDEFTIDGDEDDVEIDEGDSINVVWETSGDCSVHVKGPDLNSYNDDGDKTVYPEDSGTYRITATGDSGTHTKEIDVDVNEDGGNDDNCEITYFNASPTSINYGGVSTLSWGTRECSSVSITNLGSVNSYGSQNVYPSNTTSYTLYAYDSDGHSKKKTVQVYVNNYVAPTPIYNACAVTTVATNITRNSATLNGYISSGNGGNTYFEYGRTIGLGSTTSTRYTNNSIFSETITGLSPNTVYYYRLVSSCGNGTSQGSIEVFQTAGDTTNTKIIYQGTTVVGTESPIMLKIENRFQTIQIGDTIDYTVTYKNISNKKLKDSLLQVILPKGITFLKASRGTYSSDTYTLSIPLDTLDPGDEGEVYLVGEVDSIEAENVQVVTTALLVYTTPKGAQENAIAYVLNNPIISNAGLAALALFGWLFRMGIIGWLLLIILILLIILLVRKYYYNKRVN
ncbi:MAG TPA: hypothetical protein PKZ36_00605 [Candidatus Paceibacterota bacterium]|nr:hypothetical protein [Candidatus Paceibacterota bacterium]HPT17900.1 hypothetical protein [Candidatus Paceibacterota bacterium]